jgi:hypothetical protein
MCGRFTRSAPAAVLAELFELVETPAWTPRYNIAPTQPASTGVRLSNEKHRQIRLWRWELLPSWAKDATIGTRMINAQAETAATKPAFRAAFRQRRCLVLADGFYEWQGEGRREQPCYIRLRRRGASSRSPAERVHAQNPERLPGEVATKGGPRRTSVQRSPAPPGHVVHKGGGGRHARGRGASRCTLSRFWTNGVGARPI